MKKKNLNGLYCVKLNNKNLKIFIHTKYISGKIEEEEKNFDLSFLISSQNPQKTKK